MKENKVISLGERAKDEANIYPEELLSEGARKLLQTAIENEVVEYRKHIESGGPISAIGPSCEMVTTRNAN